MPIYEFYCADCHRIYSFLSRTVTTSAVPDCPCCGRAGLRRQASVFAISKGRKESEAPEDGLPDLDEDRLERAMASLEGEMDSIDENDPRQAARLMRRLFDATGLPVGGGMEEALRRMEGGEDPDKIDEDLGDALEDDPFAGSAGKPRGFKALRRRFLPPTVDPKLYEM
jgi:putative FmdB family regulatory protein